MLMILGFRKLNCTFFLIGKEKAKKKFFLNRKKKAFIATNDLFGTNFGDNVGKKIQRDGFPHSAFGYTDGLKGKRFKKRIVFTLIFLKIVGLNHSIN